MASNGEPEAEHSLKDLFKAYAKFGDTKATGKSMTTKNFDKWMKEAKVHNKDIKSQDSDIAFNKVIGKKPKGTKTIEFSDLEQVLSEIAKDVSRQKAKKTGKAEGEYVEETKEYMLKRLQASNMPAARGVTAAANVDVVSRLTDTSKYTGSHKERFDATGKGRGKAGRVDDDSRGYVFGYKQEGTYEQKVAPAGKK